MALKIRRGLAADRTSITPEIGEFLYTTDTKLLYIGDGSTAGGNLVTGSSGATALDELTDVTIYEPNTGDILIYNSITSQWENGPQTSGGHTIEEEGTPLTQRTKLNFVGSSVTVTDDSGDDATVVTITGSAITVWNALPTVTRTDGDTFTIPDVGNAGNWDKKLDRLRVIKWTDTTIHVAIVKSASYSSDVVTVEIAGDTLDSSFTNTSGYYTTIPVKVVTFAIAGTIATGTDLSRKFYSDCAYRVLMGKANHGTAGTTNATTYDVNKNGSTMFTTKLSVSSADTTGVDTSANNDVSLANEDYVTIDCDSVSTTLPIDAYIDLYLFPTNNIYL